MKLKFLPVAYLLAVLMLNIIATQYMVHQYFYQNYPNTIIAAVVNVLLFPVAFLIYKKGVNVND
jgi:membrane protein YdbS with pleckstrin-like domain